MSFMSCYTGEGLAFFWKGEGVKLDGRPPQNGDWAMAAWHVAEHRKTLSAFDDDNFVKLGRI